MGTGGRSTGWQTRTAARTSRYDHGYLIWGFLERTLYRFLGLKTLGSCEMKLKNFSGWGWEGGLSAGRREPQQRPPGMGTLVLLERTLYRFLVSDNILGSCELKLETFLDGDGRDFSQLSAAVERLLDQVGEVLGRRIYSPPLIAQNQ